MAGNHRPGVGHEERDVNIYAITKFGIGLSLLLIATVFVLWGLFNFFKAQLQAELPAQPESRTAVVQGKLPPEPRLQQTPRIDLQAIRSREEKLLHQYGWIDRQKGVVRIPVDRAMDLLAERGLPARPQTEAAK